MSASKRIVMVAVDGSDQAKYAFDWFLENVHREGDEVIIAHCAEYHTNIALPGLNPDVAKINELCEELKKKSSLIDEMTNYFMDILRAKKIPAKVKLLNEPKPGEALVKCAKECEVQHIVMGTRGLGAIRRTILGSVSEYLVHHCECPISIVRKHE